MDGRFPFVHRARVDYRFEWNLAKAVGNRRKHGVTFEEASSVFGDSFAILIHDPDHSRHEERFLLIGMSQDHRLLVVVFAERSLRTRLISARQTAAPERRQYEKI